VDKWEGTRFEGAFDWGGQTLLHPIPIIAVLVLGIALIVLPRRYAILPMFILACFIPSRQRLVIMTLDFNLLRIMVLFGMARLLLRREYIGFSWKSIDTVLTLYVISSMLVHTLQQGTFSAFIGRLGFGFDALGMYFLFRCLIKNWTDVDRIVLGCILISVPVAAFFFLENRTGRNMFYVFGGVSEITVERYGRLRCQGAFSHPILAGCFWASLMPLFAARWWKSANDRSWVIMGLVTSSVIVVCCASSTPVMGVLAALLGGLFFFLRRYMRVVRWGILLALIGLHIVMQAPVWHLISRVSAIGGSTSWHRYNLINQMINHFSEWWLLGVQGTKSWGIVDTTNHYILEGLRGGLLSLVLFVAMISLCFKGTGVLWRRWSHDRYRLALSWALGVSLFVHCIQFLGVSYFGQIYMVWYLLLAIIASLTPLNQVGLRTNVSTTKKPKRIYESQ
jgi:hypothetical protein